MTDRFRAPACTEISRIILCFGVWDPLVSWCGKRHTLFARICLPGGCGVDIVQICAFCQHAFHVQILAMVHSMLMTLPIIVRSVPRYSIGGGGSGYIT